MARNSPKFLREPSRGGKLVKNLEIFRMNNKTIIELFLYVSDLSNVSVCIFVSMSWC